MQHYPHNLNEYASAVCNARNLQYQKLALSSEHLIMTIIFSLQLKISSCQSKCMLIFTHPLVYSWVPAYESSWSPIRMLQSENRPDSAQISCSVIIKNAKASGLMYCDKNDWGIHSFHLPPGTSAESKYCYSFPLLYPLTTKACIASLSSGPLKLKPLTITAVPQKPGLDPEKLSNYRPIF